jgi:hypothetical protein
MEHLYYSDDLPYIMTFVIVAMRFIVFVLLVLVLVALIRWLWRKGSNSNPKL